VYTRHSGNDTGGTYVVALNLGDTAVAVAELVGATVLLTTSPGQPSAGPGTLPPRTAIVAIVA